MQDKCFWLPELIEFDGSNWESYQNNIYEIFLQDFVRTFPTYDQKRVQIRRHPTYHGKEESFFHITGGHDDPQVDRVPDLRRCERIKWPRKFIENYSCNCPIDCKDFKIWKKPYKGNYRVNFLNEKEKYLVVIEVRKKYCLLITAFYLNWPHALSDQLTYYEKAKETKNAILR